MAALKRYIVMFYDGDMNVADDEWEQVGRESHAVVAEAKAAGVWVFGGGFLDDNKPWIVDEQGASSQGALRPESSPIGGFSVLNCTDYNEATYWAAKIAKSCRCSQEVREMIWDDESTL